MTYHIININIKNSLVLINDLDLHAMPSVNFEEVQYNIVRVENKENSLMNGKEERENAKLILTSKFKFKLFSVDPPRSRALQILKEKMEEPSTNQTSNTCHSFALLSQG